MLQGPECAALALRRQLQVRKAPPGTLPNDPEEQPRLAAPGAALLPGGDRVRRLRRRTRLRKARIGGQAEVMVFTGDNLLMNMLGTVYIHLKSWLSYLSIEC